jgi:hypothetical protein
MSEEELKDVSTIAVEPDSGEILHKFWLRPDFLISFKLPADVTHEEVERLAQAVHTLPFKPIYRKKILEIAHEDSVVVARLKLWSILEHVFGAGHVPTLVRQTAERLCGGSVLYWQITPPRSPKETVDKLREIAEALAP